MRKWITLLVMACLLVFVTGVALADDPVGDGVKVTNDDVSVTIESTGYRNPTAPRYLWPGWDDAAGNQTATVSLRTEALIPCYLEMTFQGNDINALLQSWGADSNVTAATADVNGCYIAFVPAIGGYVDADWNYLTGSHGSFPDGGPVHLGGNYFEIDPGEDAFIRACDTFKATIWANLPYKYTVSVSDGALKLGAETLPVIMRTSLDEQATWSGDVTLSAAGVDVLDDVPALTESSVYHQFKVPFDREHVAGKYTGTITFVAATI